MPIIIRKNRRANCFSEIKSGVCPKCGYSRNTAAPDAEALPRGARLAGKYIIGGMIGRGGFGITYLAFDLKNDKIISLKEYFPMNIAVRERKGFMMLYMQTLGYMSNHIFEFAETVQNYDENGSPLIKRADNRGISPALSCTECSVILPKNIVVKICGGLSFTGDNMIIHSVVIENA